MRQNYPVYACCPFRESSGLCHKLKLAKYQLTPYCQPMDIRDQTEYWAFRFLIQGFGLLPYGEAMKMLSGVGRFTGRVLRIRRKVVMDQLRLVYPNANFKDLDSLANLVYHHLGLTVAEIFCGVTPAQIQAVRINPGWDELDRVMKLGHGAIIATGHIGNFELGGAVLARRYRLLDVVKPQRNVLFDRYMTSLHESLSIETVSMQHSAPRVLRHLRDGGMVSLLIDQDAGDAGLTIPFLGHPASTWPGVARISLRTGCPVIPMALIRLPDGGHELKISDPLWPTETNHGHQEIISYLERISTAVEIYIRDYPEQWFWVHRRWKSWKGENGIQ